MKLRFYEYIKPAWKVGFFIAWKLHMINEHSLITLEYNKIIEIIKGKTLTPYGSELIDEIKPLFDKEMIDKKQSVYKTKNKKEK